MDAQAQPDLTADDGVIVAKTAGEMAAEAAAAAGGFRTGPPSPPVAIPVEALMPASVMERAEREHVASKGCWCGPTVETVPGPDGDVTLSEQDVAADLGAIDPAVVASVNRPDGRPGFTEQFAGAQIADTDLVAGAIRPPVAEKLRTPPSRRDPVSGGVLAEADRIIHGDRAEAYGPAEDSFARIAALWSVHLGQQIDAYDVAILMVLMKVSRAKTDLGRDTFVDIAGYAALAPRCAAASGRDGA